MSEKTKITILGEAEDWDCELPSSETEESNYHYGIFIDPDTREVSLHYIYGNGTSLSVYHGRAVVVPLPTGAVGSEVLSLLETGWARDCLSRLCDLYLGDEFNGHTNVGQWSDIDEKSDIVSELSEEFDKVPRFGRASHWLFHDGGDHARTQAQEKMADGLSLKDIIQEDIDAARSNGVWLREDDLTSAYAELLSEDSYE